MGIFDKWDNAIDTAALAADTREVERNGGSSSSSEYEEVPTGEYEVKVERMELRESRKGDPMLSVMFRILEGSHANQCLFWNQVITQGFQIGQANTFLRALLDGMGDTNVEFQSYSQYNELIMDIFELVDGKMEYLLDYSTNKKGYPVYKIKEVFAAE